MTKPTEFEKRIRPAIESFVVDLKKLVFKLVEEAVIHGDGLDSLKNEPKPTKPKSRKKPAKPTVIDCRGSKAFIKVAQVMRGPWRDWSTRDLAKHLRLGETTVRGYLKELHANGLVERNEVVKGGKRVVTYTRKSQGRSTLKGKGRLTLR